MLAVALLAEYDYMVLSLLASLTVLLWAIFAVVRLIISAARRRWRSMASVLAVPFVVGLIGWLAHISGFSADKVRFLIWQSAYLAEVAARPGEHGPIQIGIWPWKNYAAGLIAAPQEIDVLVYDSSDQIALPLHNRTVEWFLSADRAGYSNSVIIHPEGIESADIFERNSDTRQIGTHFYIVSAEF